MRGVMVLAMATLMGTAAFAQDVKVDFDKAADFTAMKTFHVKIGTGWNNQISEERFVAAFERALTQKGWTKAGPNEADAIVALHGATDVKKSLDTFYSGGWGGYGYYGWGGGMSSSTTTMTEYTVGTLVADIFDAHTKKLVFRGTASDEISNKAEKNIKKMDKVTKKMFKDFPPGVENTKK
jgi:hypothetical protein